MTCYTYSDLDVELALVEVEDGPAIQSGLISIQKAHEPLPPDIQRGADSGRE